MEDEDPSTRLLNSLTSKALDDGVITEDEKALINSVFEDLKNYNSWMEEALDDDVIDPSEEYGLRNLLIKLFENAMKTAMDDGIITEDERELLSDLGKSFGMDDDFIKSIESKINST